MADLSFALVVALMIASGGVSVVALVVWARMSPDPDQAAHAMISRAGGETVFLFDGLDLVDCTQPARRIMDELAQGASDLHRLFRALSARFGTLPDAEKVGDINFQGEYAPGDPLDGLRLHIEGWDGFLRITLRNEEEEVATAFARPDAGEEVVTLRAVSDEAPFPIWKTDKDGTIDWINEAYLKHLNTDVDDDEDAALEWPPAALFEDHNPQISPKQRLKIKDTGGTFDIESIKHRDGWLHFATSAEDAVRAETAQKEFVQTLTNTFGHLSIGLAIFDKERRLALFNPALTDMMPVPFAFLSQRPALQDFLDRLREERLMGEPRNYKAWRKQIVELEAQAEDGTYCEHWALPNGVTFRVTGRPHLGGAIAFLFEDISAEMSLTRRFHSEIELGHAALDAMDEAIMLVGESGIVQFTNAAYRKMWHVDGADSEGLSTPHYREAIVTWRKESEKDDPHWQDMIAAMGRQDDSTGWTGQTKLVTGEDLFCRTQRLPGGATLIGFRTSAPVENAISRFKTRRDPHAKAPKPAIATKKAG
ncbi:MAG: PAS-domain containing protein [Rhodobacteraceae bacterium]|nr:PAS-domain containing protein [Paracoccaceae bacterium]